MNNAPKRVCIIGAGSSGLTTARNFLAVGFDVELIERENDLGGLWNYGSPSGRVYESTRMISSKPFTQFPDFEMPADYPDYPSHSEVLEYLRNYAAHFGITERIRFAVSVEKVAARDDGKWDVRLSTGEILTYDVIVVANGHNTVPAYPECDGEFAGETMHSAHYRTPDVFAGKRVLVVGRGNSGCDISVEAAQTAAKVFSSARRGYHFIPRYFAGIPSDQLGDAMIRRGVSLQRRREMTVAAIEREVGRLDDCGLPEPDHQLFETHPVVNTEFPIAVRSGSVISKPSVAKLDGHRVHFVDGSVEELDLIVYATGYRIQLPFLEEADRPAESSWGLALTRNMSLRMGM